MRMLAVGVASILFFAGLPAFAQSCPEGWTWIDPGNDARVADYIGSPGGKVCVEYVDARTKSPVCLRLWRDADPGPKKNLDIHCGGRALTTKGLRYSVFVHNITSAPVCARACEGKVEPIKTPKYDFPLDPRY